MKRGFCAMLLGLLLLLSPSAQPQRNVGEVLLMETGEGFHGNEIHARTGEKWLGLFLEKGQSYLATTTVRIRRVNDPVIDESPNQRTGKAVQVDRKLKPRFLVKGATTLRPGNITTIFAGLKPLKNGDSLSLQLGTESYTLKTLTKRADQQVPLAGDAKLVLTKGTSVQTLLSLHQALDAQTEDAWELLWAGDLDQDGKLDLYLNHLFYNGEEKLLFLSSQAPKNKLVRVLARFAIVGC